MICSLLAVAILVVVGCGGKDVGDRPTTMAAGGTVTYKGAPVEGASVTFSPEGGGKAAVGKTDAQGAFTLMTFEPGDGAVAGKYTIIITKRTEQPEEENENSEAPAAPPVKDLLPTKYGNPNTSKLTAEVTEGGENQFTFELTD
jgi:hypothetical protein